MRRAWAGRRRAAIEHDRAVPKSEMREQRRCGPHRVDGAVPSTRRLSALAVVLDSKSVKMLPSLSLNHAPLSPGAFRRFPPPS
jgi:hypothetical protein